MHFFGILTCDNSSHLHSCQKLIELY